jgi:hypothetical protein
MAKGGAFVPVVRMRTHAWALGNLGPQRGLPVRAGAPVLQACSGEDSGIASQGQSLAIADCREMERARARALGMADATSQPRRSRNSGESGRDGVGLWGGIRRRRRAPAQASGRGPYGWLERVHRHGGRRQ